VYDIYILSSRAKGGKERPLKMNCGVQTGQVCAGNLSTI
jgi:class 3 adenylate cyclase